MSKKKNQAIVTLEPHIRSADEVLDAAIKRYNIAINHFNSIPNEPKLVDLASYELNQAINDIQLAVAKAKVRDGDEVKSRIINFNQSHFLPT